MKKIEQIISCLILSVLPILNSCSSEKENSDVAKVYPDIESVAKEHAMQFSNKSISDMQIQQKLFEIRAHEQDLREANMNAEADYYIECFTNHLKNINPELAGKIEKE